MRLLRAVVMFGALLMLRREAFATQFFTTSEENLRTDCSAGSQFACDLLLQLQSQRQEGQPQPPGVVDPPSGNAALDAIRKRTAPMLAPAGKIARDRQRAQQGLPPDSQWDNPDDQACLGRPPEEADPAACDRMNRRLKAEGRVLDQGIQTYQWYGQRFVPQE